jgi:hypothetical protein
MGADKKKTTQCGLEKMDNLMRWKEVPCTHMHMYHMYEYMPISCAKFARLLSPLVSSEAFQALLDCLFTYATGP